jgi:L-ascorbate metabolism protein UlaG (beta-lactamase superfamily)
VKDVRITHIGGPTALIEIDGRRLLTDPTFDAPGRRYSFGWGTTSRKLIGLRPRTAIPLHYEGWSHFRQGRGAVERELARAPEDIRRRFRWLPIGMAVDLAPCSAARSGGGGGRRA